MERHECFPPALDQVDHVLPDAGLLHEPVLSSKKLKEGETSLTADGSGILVFGTLLPTETREYIEQLESKPTKSPARRLSVGQQQRSFVVLIDRAFLAPLAYKVLGHISGIARASHHCGVAITPHHEELRRGRAGEAKVTFCRHLQRWEDGQPLRNIPDKMAAY
jgi:hypothetical protein